jgi:hypothetical protein
MKLYFDTLKHNESNQKHLSKTKDTDWWIVSQGPVTKKVTAEMGLEHGLVDRVSTPGLYIIDVNGDPDWWCGASTPSHHVLKLVKPNIIRLAQRHLIRIVIAADREGGAMVTDRHDFFSRTTFIMKRLNLPPLSVLITQGNYKIEDQYEAWLKKNKKEKRMFEVMHSNHFGNIFNQSKKVENELKRIAVLDAMEDKSSRDYNSLNRVARPHRMAHLYRLITDNILSKGLVSCNQLDLNSRFVTDSLKIETKTYQRLMKSFYPKHIDGDWSEENAANFYNLDIYKQSLMSVITETIFIDDVAFVTEKIWKPLTFGHPMILFAGQGTLRAVEDMGFRIDWCGIDPSYNDIKDPVKRFNATQQVLVDWCSLSRREQCNRITNSMATIEHNYKLMKERDLYKESIQEIVRRTEKYFELKKI